MQFSGYCAERQISPVAYVISCTILCLYSIWKRQFLFACIMRYNAIWTHTLRSCNIHHTPLKAYRNTHYFRYRYRPVRYTKHIFHYFEWIGGKWSEILGIAFRVSCASVSDRPARYDRPHRCCFVRTARARTDWMAGNIVRFAHDGQCARVWCEYMCEECMNGRQICVHWWCGNIINLFESPENTHLWTSSTSTYSYKSCKC